MRTSFVVPPALIAALAATLALGCGPATAGGIEASLPPPPAAVRRETAASAARPGEAANPFATADLAAMLRRCTGVRVEGGAQPVAVLARTGDRIALGDVAARALLGRLDGGTWTAAIPFANAAGAQHGVVVLGWLAGGPRYVGGFAAAGDHLSLNVARTIDVEFFRSGSRGRTLAAGGAAPSSSMHLTIAGGRLASLAPAAPAATEPVEAVADIDRP